MRPIDHLRRAPEPSSCDVYAVLHDRDGTTVPAGVFLTLQAAEHYRRRLESVDQGRFRVAPTQLMGTP